MLAEHAVALNDYAADVLEGDFSVFTVLNRRLAERYKLL